MKFYCRDKQIVQFLNLYLICALEWLEDISPDPIWKEQKRCPFLGVWDRNLRLVPLPYVLCRVQGSYPDGRISLKLYRQVN